MSNVEAILEALEVGGEQNFCNMFFAFMENGLLSKEEFFTLIMQCRHAAILEAVKVSTEDLIA